MASLRADRVGDLIRKEIAMMLQQGGVKDPRIGLVTITLVKMSADLKQAKVYFSMIGSDSEKQESLKGLQSASGFIRRMLASNLNLRSIPAVKFFYDDSLEYSSHMAEVFKEING